MINSEVSARRDQSKTKLEESNGPLSHAKLAIYYNIAFRLVKIFLIRIWHRHLYCINEIFSGCIMKN